MRKTIIRAVLAGLIALSAASAVVAQTPPVLPASPAAWSAAAVRDIESGYRLFADNHPGMLNERDPGFPARLDAARARGLGLAARATDGRSYSAALLGFTYVLRDGHALLFDNLPAASAPPRRWPGFVTAWRGDHLRVLGSTLPELRVGAALESCDGRAANALIRSNVFEPGYNGDPDLPGAWWNKARFVFIDDDVPSIDLPDRCHFFAEGQSVDITLSWRPVDAQFRQWNRRAGNGEALPPGLTEPRPGLFWLALPTFQPDETARATYRAAFDALRARRSSLQVADAIVIDLRDNQGGSSSWSEDAAKAIWGDGPVARLLAADPSRIWWRASPGNTRYVRSLVALLRQQSQAADAAFIDTVATGMESALAAGRPFFVEPLDARLATPATPASDAAPLRPPVYVIVPGQCASSCLDALDLFTRLPNTKLIGAPSSADTDYLEVRAEPLTGGLATAVIPTKLYRDRPRKSGESYQPAIEVDALDWSTEAFRAVVEGDLER